MFAKITVAALVASGLMIPVSAHATASSYNVANQPISFVAPNPPNTTDVLAGATSSTAPHRYSNVVTVSGTQIDALVSIVSLQNSESSSGARDDKMARVDDNDSNPVMDTRFRNSSSAAPTLGFAVFDVQFVIGGTTTPAILRNIALTVKDIDNNQFVEFAGLSSYVLASNRQPVDVNAYTGTQNLTVVTADPGSPFTVPVTVPAGSVLFFASGSSDDTEEAHWVESKFAEISTLRVKLGSFEPGSANFGLDFQLANFAGSTDQPVVVNQPAFTVAYDPNSGSGNVPAATTGSGAITVAGNAGSPSLSKTGFVFAGWNTRADGSGVSYAAGSSILPVANTTLFAMWTAVTEPADDSELARTGSDSSIALALVAAGAFIVFGLIALRRKRHSV